MECLDLIFQAQFWTVTVTVLAVLMVRKASPATARSALLFALLFLAALLSYNALQANQGGTHDSVRAVLRLCVGVGLINLMAIALFRALLPFLKMASPRILHDLVVAVAILFWTLYELQNFGVHLSSIVATSAVLTAVLGFAFQDTLSNAVAGLALQLDRSIAIGDAVQFDGVGGRVAETNWRYTALETANGDTLVVPNSLLVRNKVLVLGRRKEGEWRQRRWIWFNVDFRYPPGRVTEVAEAALQQADIPFVGKEPAPSCLHMEFTESYSKYALRYWVTDIDQDLQTDSKVRSHIEAALERADIALSIPAHAVFMTEETEQRIKSKESQEVEDRTQALQRVEIFRQLPRAELLSLASGLEAARFETGGLIARQGEESTCLYLVRSGHADVIVETERVCAKVGEVHAGSFFGEWGLLTGEPRHATVVARSRMTVYTLDKEPFERLLKSRPAIAQEISEVMAQRRAQNDLSLQDLDTEEQTHRFQQVCGDILGRIRKLFGLGD